MKAEFAHHKVDSSALQTIEKFLQVPQEQLTTGRIEASFHASERDNGPADSNYVGAFPIVAIGASAGGVESYTELLSHLPTDTGMAFVLIQHLAANHESLLPAILSRVTQMEVIRAETDMKIEPNRIYVIPPNANMGILHGHLKLLPRLESPSRHQPVDFFFRCLADDQQHLAIGVILSGADGDGAQGLRAIRGLGGITIVQEPATAKVDGMPRNAIAAGGTDTILPIPEIAKELVRLSQHPFSHTNEGRAPESTMTKIFAILKNQTGVDFAKYKPGTISRRLRRRIILHRVDSAEEYLGILQSNRAEVLNLYNDFLINVTNFFRDPEVFEMLKVEVFPKLLRKQQRETPVRIWVAGCATGEEVYSLGMALFETMEELSLSCAVQIFASDISENALEVAREAFYNSSIHVDVTPERIRRFFTKVSGGYRVIPALREICVFAQHDLTRDPPFSRLDLISCRNLMIYLEASHQQKIINLFSYALNPQRFLLLGNSETVGNTQYFEPIDKQSRIYSRKNVINRGWFDVSLSPHHVKASLPRSVAKTTDVSVVLGKETARILMDRFVPAGLVVDARATIVQVYGQTGDFIEPSPGEASLNLFKMARPGLDTELREAFKKVEKSKKPYRREGRRMRGLRETTFALEVIPFTAASEEYYIILFDQRHDPRERTMLKAATDPSRKGSKNEILDLRSELASTREHLQSIIREHELANEELQAASEEVISSNEELQSTNEELETAKEELQSSNEELTTVNDELTSRNSQLMLANNDLSNLLSSVNIPIVMVGNDLRIRRFTPMVERVLNLIPSDIGRPITHIKPNFDIPDLEASILRTIESITTFDREVQDRTGHRYSLRIRPYRTTDNKIDGAVLILFDLETFPVGVPPRVTDVLPAEAMQLGEAILFLDDELRVQGHNAAFLREFQVSSDEIFGRSLFAILNGSWAGEPMLKALLNEMIHNGTKVADYNVKHEFPSIGERSYSMNAQRVTRDGSKQILMIFNRNEA